MQTICEKSGVNMIPIYLERNISDIIVSSTRFGSFSSQARILRLNKLALDSMIKKLKNVFTIRYSNFNEDTTKLLSYIGLDIKLKTFNIHTYNLTSQQNNYMSMLGF